MITKKIETNIVIAEKEDVFFKEVVFDFDSLPPQQQGWFQQVPNIASRLFMIQNVDESIEVKAYPTRDSAVMFNAWITKNISYKVAAQSPKEIDCNSPLSDTVETVGIGMKDAAGYPTVYGPLYHMTKVIDFGGIIKLDLPSGKKLRDTDVVEVLSAKIIGSHDELLNPEPIYDYEPGETKYMELELPINDPLHPDGPPQYIKVKVPMPVSKGKYKKFDPELTQYTRLREKMCIKIKVRVIRKENVDIDF